MKIEIEYDGQWPNLCSGDLTVIVDGKRWEFPKYTLIYGGSCSFSGDYSTSIVKEGDWSIDRWPKGFPENLKGEVADVINDQIKHGCYGRCL